MVQKTVKLSQIFRLELNPMIVMARPSDQDKVFVRFQPSEDEYYIIQLDSATVASILQKRKQLKQALESEITLKGTVVEHKKRVERDVIVKEESWESV